jgi:hypothetical protein
MQRYGLNRIGPRTTTGYLVNVNAVIHWHHLLYSNTMSLPDARRLPPHIPPLE